MLDALAHADAIKDVSFLLSAIWWNDESHGLADHLFGAIAVEIGGRAIPTGDPSVEAEAEDRVIGAFDERGQALHSLEGSLIIALRGTIAKGCRPVAQTDLRQTPSKRRLDVDACSRGRTKTLPRTCLIVVGGAAAWINFFGLVSVRSIGTSTSSGDKFRPK